MVIKYDDVLTLVTTLGDEEGLQVITANGGKFEVTVKESLKGGLIAGTSCAIGGTLFGPAGLAAGGIIGSCAAAYLAQNKFKPVSEVILKDMSPENQRQLVECVQRIIGNLDASDAVQLMALVHGSNMLKTKIIAEMVTFFSSNLKMPITQ